MRIFIRKYNQMSNRSNSHVRTDQAHASMHPIVKWIVLSTIHAISCLIILIAAFLPAFVWGQDEVRAYASESSRATLELKSGTKIDYEAWAIVNPLQPPVREDFWVTIKEIWKGGVTFEYELEQKVIGSERGMQNLSSLDECKSLDPWWEPMASAFDDRCELWIPRRVYMELLANQKSWLAVDTLARRDSTVRWELQGKIKFLCEIDGHPILLNALKIKTSREDEFVILNDPDNPLILSAKSTYFSWNVSRIITQ